MLGTRARYWYLLFLLRHHNLRRDDAMQAVMMIRRYLKTTCASMHATWLTVLCVAVEALIYGGRLTVTGLADIIHNEHNNAVGRTSWAYPNL
jgi:hypothetical protein